MPIRNFVNTAQPTSLTSGVDTDDTTLPVVSTTGYPSAPFTVAIDRGGANEEVVLVQGKTSNTLTDCVRGYNGTAAQSHLSAVSVEHCAIALDYSDANGHIYNTARDDHTQYLNEDRLAALDLASIVLPYSVPIGGLVPFSGTVSPDADLWLLCYGQAVSRATYDALFGVIGTVHGVGDGISTFNVPDLRGRGIVGLDNMGGASANVVTAAAADTVGGAFGTETHTLTTAEIPAHAHTINHTHAASATTTDGSHAHSPGAGTAFLYAGGGGIAGFTNGTFGPFNEIATTAAGGSHAHTVNTPSFTGSSGNAGGGGSHPNTQPSRAFAILIKAA